MVTQERDRDPDHKLIAAERDVLRAMCQGTEGGPVWDDGLRHLSSYRFRDATHQVVFDVLRRIGSGHPEIVRQHLPRRLALAGFPDLDAQVFFEPHGLDHRQATELIQWLVGAARGAPP